MSLYTKNNNGFWAVSIANIDESWIKVSIKDGVVNSPSGLVKQIEKEQIFIKVNECKSYLDKTEHKFNGDYEPKEGEDLEAIKSKRNEVRKFIRDNK